MSYYDHRFSASPLVHSAIVCTIRLVRVRRHSNIRTRPFDYIFQSDSLCRRIRTLWRRYLTVRTSLFLLASTTFPIDLSRLPLPFHHPSIQQHLARKVLCESIAVLQPLVEKPAPSVKMMLFHLYRSKCQAPATTLHDKTRLRPQ